MIQFSVQCDFLWLPASHAAHPHFPLSLTQTLPPKRLCHCPSPSFQLETPAPSPAYLLVILQVSFKVPPSLQPSSPSPHCSTALYRNLNAALVSYRPQQSFSLPPLLGCSVPRSRDLVFVFFSLFPSPAPVTYTLSGSWLGPLKYTIYFEKKLVVMISDRIIQV